MSGSTGCIWMLRAFNERIMGPAHVENVTDLAVRTALSYRAVSHLTFPVDFQEMEVKSRQRSKRNIPHHTSHAEAGGAMLADSVDLEKAAQILNDGKKVAILAGRGALQAAAELEQVAEVLGAPIVKALLGRPPCPMTVHTRRERSDYSVQSRPRRQWRHATHY